VNPLDRIAEERLAEAIARGDFDDLPGLGRPLEIEDLSRVPEDLRASYLLLRGAGVLPEELELRRQALRLADLLAACTSDGQRAGLLAERERLLFRVELLAERRRSGR
jgi:hypothetical protein